MIVLVERLLVVAVLCSNISIVVSGVFRKGGEDGSALGLVTSNHRA